MVDDFTPPIKSRPTDELLEIVGSSDKWNPKAVRLAYNELVYRNVKAKKVETAKYLSKKKNRIERGKMANESYHIWDFIFRPFPTLFEIVFSWELKKNGFDRKARQQKYFRIVIGLMILFCLVYSYLH